MVLQCKVLFYPSPTAIPFDDLIVQRNGSTEYDGVFNVFTGTDDVSKLLELDMWNGVKKTKYLSSLRVLGEQVINAWWWFRYYQSHCGMINGSFGEGWPPYRTRTEISLYATDLCRFVMNVTMCFFSKEAPKSYFGNLLKFIRIISKNVSVSYPDFQKE